MPVTRHPTRRTLAGTLLILVIITFGAGIFFLDDLIRLFERRTQVVALLPSAPGVVRGTPVWIAGERVGRVTSVAFLQRGDAERVAVTLEIPTRLRPHIDRDTYARITSARLIGEPVLDLVLAGEPGATLPPGDTLAGRRPIGREELMAHASRLRAGFDTLATTFGTVLEGSVLDDGRLGLLEQRFAAVARELGDLRAASASGTLALLSGDTLLRDRFDRLSVTAARLAAIGGDSTSDRHVQLERLRHAFADVRTDADSLATAIGRLRATDPAHGSFGRFAADSALSVALRQLQVQLDSLVREVRSNPFRFVF